MAEEEEPAGIDKDLQLKLYDDIGHQAAQKMGVVLGEVFEGATSWWVDRLRLYNAKRKIIYARNLKLLSQKIDSIPDENILEVPFEISEPIMQKLTYTSNEDVAKLFIELLSVAANDQTAADAHPAFIEIISRMSVDEAKILKYLKGKSAIGYLDIRVNLDNKHGGGSNVIAKHLTGIEYWTVCALRQNINIYLDNLSTLGLIEIQQHSALTNEKHYLPLYTLYQKQFDELKIEFNNPHDYGEVFWAKGFYEITDFGKLFIEVCTDNIPINTNTIR